MRRVRVLILLCIMVAGCLCMLNTHALSESAHWPEEGNNVKTNGKMKTDISHISEGYFMAAVTKSNKNKLKLRVVKGDETLTYDLNGNAKYEVFPLQLGDGKYEISLYENVSGKKYSQAGKISINVKLSSSTIPFLYPNQYVFYTKASEAVSKADELCKGKNQKQSFEAICSFLKKGFIYDYVKAATVKAGTLPEVDQTYATKLGVCQDFAALMACMLRTQGIPCKMVIGYADKQYHAWTVAIINGEEKFYDPTAALNAISKVKKYTAERFY